MIKHAFKQYFTVANLGNRIHTYPIHICDCYFQKKNIYKGEVAECTVIVRFCFLCRMSLVLRARSNIEIDAVASMKAEIRVQRQNRAKFKNSGKRHRLKFANAIAS